MLTLFSHQVKLVKRSTFANSCAATEQGNHQRQTFDKMDHLSLPSVLYRTTVQKNDNKISQASHAECCNLKWVSLFGGYQHQEPLKWFLASWTENQTNNDNTFDISKHHWGEVVRPNSAASHWGAVRMFWLIANSHVVHLMLSFSQCGSVSS